MVSGPSCLGGDIAACCFTGSSFHRKLRFLKQRVKHFEVKDGEGIFNTTLKWTCCRVDSSCTIVFV